MAAPRSMNASALAPINGPSLADLEQRVADLEVRLAAAPDANAMTVLVFSGELDKLLAAFTIATGAAASGLAVSMFFTFWGTAALKARTRLRGKAWVERAFGMLLPGGLGRRALSRLDMLGAGRLLIKREMKHKNISSLPVLIEQAAGLGVQIYVCEMSMDLMGIHRQELIDYPDLKFCGAVKFADLAASGNTTLFI